MRPGMYIGSTDLRESSEFVMNSEGKMSIEKITYVPALLKIINEVLDNSIDEGIKTSFEYSNKIDVTITDTKVVVKDNGRGFPVQKNEKGELLPVIAVCNARTGSNFTSDRESIGTHGIGVKATNIFSKYFCLNTCDGKKRLIVECSDNMSKEIHRFSYTDTKSTGSEVTFIPDLKRFNQDKISDTIKDLVRLRLTMLSRSFEKISFTFNGSSIKLKSSRDVVSLFADESLCFNGKNWFIGVFPSEDFTFFSYVNGISLERGGSHIDLISQDISYAVRDLFTKKYPSLKPADVKNKLGFVVFFNSFPNMRFDSQTKETLTNSTPEVRDFLGQEYTPQKFAEKISKTDFLMNPIIDMSRLKEELKRREELKKLSKNKKEVDSEKYFPPIGKKKYLMITEGYSAFAGISPILGRRDIAYYALRGKPLNTFESDTRTLLKNEEFKDLINILDLDLSNENTGMSFDKVVFLSDQDSDGCHIRALLLTFFDRFAPKMIKDGRVCMMNTPLIIAFDKKNVAKKWYFSLEEYSKSKHDPHLRYKYYKGLGSFKPADLKQVLEAVGGMDTFLVPFEHTDKSHASLKDWMSNSTAGVRKDLLKDRKCNISSV